MEIKEFTISEITDQMCVTGKSFDGTFSIDQEDNKRLGIKPLKALDGPRGLHYLKGKSIAYPVPLAMAASFDIQLIEDVYSEMGKQVINKGCNQLYAPGLNIILDPRCGRNSEYFSEDQYLTAEMGIAAVKGLEKEGCISTPKHFVCNNFETGRFVNNVNVPVRVLHEIFLYAFKRVITETNPGSIMTSYNSVNGNFITANKKLIRLLHEWGFEGLIISDWGANMESTENSILAGAHIDMPGRRFYKEDLIEGALKNGLISEKDILNIINRIIKVKEKYGLVGNKLNKVQPLNLDLIKKLNLKASTDGIVLLKNSDKILPLNPNDLKNITVIGEFADSEDALGNNGSSTVFPEYCITPLEALKSSLPNCNIDYHKGYDYLSYAGSVELNDMEFEVEYFSSNDFNGKVSYKSIEKGIHHDLFIDNQQTTICTGIKKGGLSFSGQYSSVIGEISETKLDEEFTFSCWFYLNDQFPNKEAPVIEISGQNLYISCSMKEIKCRTLFDLKTINSPYSSQKWVNFILEYKNRTLSILIDGNECIEMNFDIGIPELKIFGGGSILNSQYVKCIISEISLYDIGLNSELIDRILKLEDVDDHRVYYNDCDTNNTLDRKYNIQGIERSDNFSARYTCDYKATISGKYLFKISGQDGVRLFVNGKCYINSWNENNICGQNHFAWIEMEKDSVNKITVEYNALRSNGFLKFSYIQPPKSNIFNQIINSCINKDVVLFFAGIKAELFQGESNDLDSIILPGWQDELLEKITEVNSNVIVMLHTAGGVDMRKWNKKVKGIIQTWYSGQEVGNAIKDILFGNVCPSGKLPVTFPIDVNQLEENFMNSNYSKSVKDYGYRRYESKGIKPLYSFGYGLSYTTFEMKNFTIYMKNEKINISLSIQNKGEFKGAEVVQIYVSYINNNVERPLKELKAFKKIMLEPKEIKTTSLEIPYKELYYYDELDDNWVKDNCSYKILVGNSSDNILYDEEIIV